MQHQKLISSVALSILCAASGCGSDSAETTDTEPTSDSSETTEATGATDATETTDTTETTETTETTDDATTGDGDATTGDGDGDDDGTVGDGDTGTAGDGDGETGTAGDGDGGTGTAGECTPIVEDAFWDCLAMIPSAVTAAQNAALSACTDLCPLLATDSCASRECSSLCLKNQEYEQAYMNCWEAFPDCNLYMVNLFERPCEQDCLQAESECMGSPVCTDADPVYGPKHCHAHQWNCIESCKDSLTPSYDTVEYKSDGVCESFPEGSAADHCGDYDCAEACDGNIGSPNCGYEACLSSCTAMTNGISAACESEWVDCLGDTGSTAAEYLCRQACYETESACIISCDVVSDCGTARQACTQAC